MDIDNPEVNDATASTINKVAITAPATGATLTIVEGATLTASATANVSGTNTGDQTITLTGDVTGSGTGSFATTIKNDVALGGSPTTTTQSPSNNTTKISTTAYVDAAIAALPATLHNGLPDLQGGTSGEYYHVTSAQHTGLTGLDNSLLTSSDGSGNLASVSDLTAWIAGTADQITVTDNADGTVTLSAPQDLDTAATFQVATLGVGKAPASIAHIYEDSAVAGATAGLTIEQDGVGDAVCQFLLTGGQRWVMGIDNSDSDKFKIASSVDLNSDAELTIDTTGKVGIGQATPTALLHLGAATNQDLIYFGTERAWKFTTSGTGATTALVLRTENSNKKFVIASQNGTSNFTLSTNNTAASSTVAIPGALSKGSGSFDIAHPDPKKAGMRLRHYFVETPSAGGNIYKYQFDCVRGNNMFELPDYFKHLNKDTIVYACPYRHFGSAYGDVTDNELTLIANAKGTYNVFIFADRKDAGAIEDFNNFGIEYEEKLWHYR